MVVENKIQEYIKRHEINNFWECLRLLKDIGHEEIEAIMMSTELFDGKIWDDVFYVKNWVEPISISNINNFAFSGIVGTVAYTGMTEVGSPVFGVDPALDDEINPFKTKPIKKDDKTVIVYTITKKGNRIKFPIYRAYLKTNKYENHPEIDDEIKMITLGLSTELGIQLFDDGFEKLKL